MCTYQEESIEETGLLGEFMHLSIGQCRNIILGNAVKPKYGCFSPLMLWLSLFLLICTMPLEPHQVNWLVDTMILWYTLMFILFIQQILVYYLFFAKCWGYRSTVVGKSSHHTCEFFIINHYIVWIHNCKLRYIWKKKDP